MAGEIRLPSPLKEGNVSLEETIIIPISIHDDVIESIIHGQADKLFTAV